MKTEKISGHLRPLHVCIATQQLRNVISGVGLHAKNLINHLLADGHQVTVIVPQNQLPDPPISFSYVKVSNNILINNHARWLPTSYHFSVAIQELEKQKKIDLIHFTDAREALFYKSKIPIVGNVNDTYAIDKKSPLYYRRYYTDWISRWLYYSIIHQFEKITYPRLNAIITNSHYTSNILISKYPVNPHKVHTIHKSIDLNLYCTLPRFSNLNHPPRILFVGGNMQRKGLPTLIFASQQIIKIFPDCEFLVVGKDNAENKMKSLTEKLGVHNHFIFWGWQDQAQLIQLYRKSDIFVLPSLTEAFGVVILEAMACGIPVIASNVGGIPEIITDGENGILVPPDDSKILAEVIINLLQDNLFRENLIKNAFTTIKKFDVSIMMNETYKIYSSLIYP